jgi:hypothetical protein
MIGAGQAHDAVDLNAARLRDLSFQAPALEISASVNRPRR